MASFDKLATVTGGTLRGGVVESGLEKAYTVQVSTLKCLPLDPVSPEIAMGVEGLSFREILQTTVENSLGIREGDILVVNSVPYPVRAVEDWKWKSDTFQLLLLEDRK